MAMTFPSNPTTGQQYSVSGGPTYTWDGTVWKILTPGSQFSEQQFTATAGQTTFTVSGGYVIGAVDVYRNGVKLVIGLDFTATDLSTVVLTNAASAGDTIEVVSVSQILYTDALKKTSNLSDVANAATALSNLGGLPKAGGTMTGALDLGSIGQLKFPATQNASSNANTLDDYEEGTWTPTVGGNATYSVQGGSYTKIGRVVHLNFDLRVSTLGTGSSRYITGLPFPHVYNGSARNAGSVNWFTGLAVAGTAFYLELDSNGIYLGYTSAAGGTISEPAWIGNGASVMGSVWYVTNT